MKLPLQLSSIAAAFIAAQTLVYLATQEANAASEERDEKETVALAEAYDKRRNRSRHGNWRIKGD